jgi:hypothetical protein
MDENNYIKISADELNENILAVLDRREDELQDTLAMMERRTAVSDDFVKGYKNGYMELLEDLRNLLQCDRWYE